MIGYYLGGYLLTAAIFCGIVGGREAFNFFASLGVLVLLVSMFWGMVR